MDQEDGGGGDMNEQPQAQPQPQTPPPQRCPRCDSANTKFCYYNNYSLSQPRYFCKTCKRYWTHGGTLRNVPVGGGGRKGKRAKTSTTTSSAETCRSQPRQEVVPSTTSSSRGVAAPAPATVPSISQFYQGGGYLSSLAAIHSLNPSQPFNHLGSDAMGSCPSSHLGLLAGFNAASLSQRQIRPSSQLFQTGNRESEVESLYAAEQGLIQTSMIGNSSSASPHDWSQSHRAPDGSLWSTISTTSIADNSGINNTASAGSSSLVPNQWPNLPGYGPPP